MLLKRRSFLHSLAAIMLIICMGGCASEPEQMGNDASQDEREEFQQEILADIDKVDTFILKTNRGVNLSEFSLGWFAMILLNELSAQDQELFDYLHADGRNVEAYLRTAFQNDPKSEIGYIGVMSLHGKRPIRLSARFTLEMLTTIPDAKDTPALQAKSRKDLAAILYKLRAALALVAAEATPQLIPIPQ